jgi:molybdopterin-guanine dinucleotide biosynthesis adapter protein
MRVFGLAGWSGSGKTTLLTKLIPALNRRGISVSTLKHAHHKFDVDQPGKDSWLHRESGAHEVLVSSEKRWVLMHELRGAAEPSLDELLAQMNPVDLILIEGFKRGPQPKIEIHRPSLGKPLLAPEDDAIVAIAADAAIPDARIPVLALGDIEAIASFIISYCRLEVVSDGTAQR